MKITLNCRTMTLTLLLASLTSVAHSQQTTSSPAINESTARGIKLYQQGDTNGAVKAFRLALKTQKKDADAWHFLGLALLKSEQPKDARKAFETAIKLRPKAVESHVGLSYALLLTNKTKAATLEAELALGLSPDVALAHYILGVVRLREGKPTDSLREAETALRIDANITQAHLLRSQALLGVFLKESQSEDKTVAKGRWPRLRDATESLQK